MKPVDSYATKPYTRWWWFSGPLDKSSIEDQLEWMAANGFGGMEIAWVYPLSIGHLGPKWLDRQWQSLVAIAKKCCDRHGLGCDFTFGTLWPFGGSFVQPEDASWTFDGPSEQRLDYSWEHGVTEPGRIVNHLSRGAFERYAATMGGALAEALQGSTSALFCDSWEIDASGLWSPELWGPFEQQCGYSLQQYKDRLDECPEVRYDYRKFLSQVVIDQFYKPFTGICHSLGAWSRVQCHGSPTDLLEAYAAADIPETEALLFPTTFARIPASAAVLTSKPIVSSETFTCMYGFPAVHFGNEQIADLKLLADAVFAHGVNHIVWHGTPFNPIGARNRFFATVHVGPDAAFAEHLPEFNRYLATVCKWMRSGRPYTNLAAYFPLEDNRMLGELPTWLRTPAARYYWEMRYTVPPKEIKGYHPVWVSEPFLRGATCEAGRLRIGMTEFDGLYVDCDWLDTAALQSILLIARAGVPVVMTRRPNQPGRRQTDAYAKMTDDLLGLRNVVNSVEKLGLRPFIEGENLPFYWARHLGDSVIVFFAHPKARDIAYPMRLGQSFCENTVRRTVTVNAFNRSVPFELAFEPYQSLLVRIDGDGKVSPVNIRYAVPHPEMA
jgi:hypothetical protein